MRLLPLGFAASGRLSAAAELGENASTVLNLGMPGPLRIAIDVGFTLAEAVGCSMLG